MAPYGPAEIKRMTRRFPDALGKLSDTFLQKDETV